MKKCYSHWLQAIEATSLSSSRLHFGHYKAQHLDSSISSIRVSIINLSIKNRTLMSRRRKLFSIMLEKSHCKMNVSKLRPILLLEEDFNSLLKIMFIQRILSALEKHNLIPMEIIGGRKCKDTIHIFINKKLIVFVCN